MAKIAVGVITTLVLVGGGAATAILVHQNVEERKRRIKHKIESALIRFDVLQLNELLKAGEWFEVEDVGCLFSFCNCF